MGNRFEEYKDGADEKKSGSSNRVDVSLDASSVDARLESRDAESCERRARVIAQLGEYSVILNGLKQEELLDGEMERMRRQYGERLDSVPENVLEILTVTELYDPDTFLHELDTADIVRRKLTTLLEHDIVLATVIREQESIGMDDVVLAAMLHDTGKIAIPREILKNSLKDDEILSRLSDLPAGDVRRIFQDAGIEWEPDAEDVFSQEAIKQLLVKNGTRAYKVVPALLLARWEWERSREEAGKTDESDTAYQADLEERIRLLGLSPNAPAGDIIRIHEHQSESVLLGAGINAIVAEIAGHHHNYEHTPLRYPLANGTVILANIASDILQLADMQHAMQGKRGYQERGAFDPSIIWMEMARVSQREVNGELGCVFIEDEMRQSKNPAYGKLLDEAKRAGEINDDLWNREEFQTLLPQKDALVKVLDFILREETVIDNRLAKGLPFSTSDDDTRV